jgi:hypothetical protein
VLAAGDVLGMVGESGETQFAHVHLSVRKDGKDIDPFIGEPATVSCHAGSTRLPDATLWKPEIRSQLEAPMTAVLEVGFADSEPTLEVLEDGHSNLMPPQRTTPLLRFYARLMHLHAGDRVRLRADFPGGTPMDLTGEPLPRDKAVYVLHAARRRGSEPWPAGRYAGHVDVLRDGGVIATADTAFELK